MDASTIYLQFGTQMAVANGNPSMSVPAGGPYTDYYYVGETLSGLSTPCPKAAFFSRGALILFRTRKSVIEKSTIQQSVYKL